MHAHRWPRVLAFLTGLGVGLSAAYWGLRLGEGAPDMPTAAASAAVPPVDAAAVVAALGGAPVQPGASAPVSQRYELVGVVAQGRQGVALLSIDGQPAQPVVVGGAVGERLKLLSVGHRRAELAERSTGVVVQRLQMPEPPVAELPAGMKLVQSGRP